MRRVSAIDTDGMYRWADAYQNSEEWYCVKCGDYLTNENDTLDSVAWTIPAELTLLDEQTIGNDAFVKLRADTIGVHVISVAVNSSESLNTQKLIEKIRLVVL